MIDIKELRRLAEEATKGEWKAEHMLGCMESVVIRCDDGTYDIIASETPDAAYIVAVQPSVLIELLSEIETLQENFHTAYTVGLADAREAVIFDIDVELIDDLIEKSRGPVGQNLAALPDEGNKP
jgi:hypothetical protein